MAGNSQAIVLPRSGMAHLEAQRAPNWSRLSPK